MSTGTAYVGQSLVATAVPQEADGTTTTPGAVVSGQSWSVSDATVASVTTNTDGTATLKALSAGTVSVGVTAWVTDPGGTATTFTGGGTLIVSAAPVTASLGVSFGAAS